MSTGLPIPNIALAGGVEPRVVQSADLFPPTEECTGEDACALTTEESVPAFISSENSQSTAAGVSAGPVELGLNPDLWLYRERTIALLKRYLRISIEVGRLPSLLGRELFRSKVTSYRMSSFEDAVIFVHDVERALDQLDGFGKDLVAVIIFQDYSQDEAAEVLHCARRTVCREFPETVDKISELFLDGGLLNRLPPRRPVENKNVQSMAQFPFQNAILKIESKKKERASRALFIFCAFEASMGTRARQAGPPEELSELRRKISELVAQNAVPMVQQAIDAVREEGQYQAMKYLFEMVGLYPAVAQEDSESQESLAQLLLDQLGLVPSQAGKHAARGRTELTDRHPVE